MSCRRDPLLKELNRLFRATALRVPETRIQPLCLFALEKKRFSYRGRIEPLLEGSPPKFIVNHSEMPLEILGNKVINIDAFLGLSFLDGLIKGLSGQSAPFAGAFKNAKKLAFQFVSPMRQYIDLNAIGAVLRNKKIDIHNPSLYPFLHDEAKLLVITSIIVCKEFQMSISESKNAEAGINVPVLNDLISNLDTNVSVVHQSNRTIKVSNEIPLTFALTAAPIIFDSTTGEIRGIGLELDPNDIAMSGVEKTALQHEPIYNLMDGEFISWTL